MNTLRTATALALAALVSACTPFAEVPADKTITCGECPEGYTCRDGYCVDPDDIPDPPDLAGPPQVDPLVGKVGVEFTVRFEITQALASGTTPALTLGLVPPVVVPCQRSGASQNRSYECRYTATGEENDARGGVIGFDLRMQGVAQAGTLKPLAGALNLDFTAPTVAVSTPQPVVPLGGQLLLVVTPNEALSQAPVLVVRPALGSGSRFPLVHQSGTPNWTFTHVVTASDPVGVLTFDVEVVDEAENPATRTLVLDEPVRIDPVPPDIAALTVTPGSGRIGKTGAVSASFTIAKPGVEVFARLGGREGTCLATGATWTCTWTRTGMETADGTEERQALVIEASDAAGNRGVESTSVVFDFAAPEIAVSNLPTAPLPRGGTLQLVLTPNESLGQDPVLVASRALVTGTSTATRFTLARQANGIAYVFSHVVDAGDPQGAVSFSLEIADTVGNTATPAVGTLGIDRDLPQLTNLAVSSSDPSSGGIPLRLRSGVTLNARFDASESGEPTVTVGGRTTDCGARQAASPNYTCSRAVAPDTQATAGTESVQTVQVTFADSAGNPASASASVVYDFKAPAVIDSSVVYTPAPGNPLTSVSRATTGTTVRVTVLANEALDAGFVPTLFAAAGALAFTYVPLQSTATSAVFEAVVPQGLADGDYVPTLRWRDVAGNELNGTAGLQAVRVKTSTPTFVVDQDALVFVRSPWGAASPENLGSYTIPAGPYFAIEPSDPLSPSGALPTGALVLGGGTLPEAVQVLSAANGLLIGTLRPTGGRFPRQALVSPDVPAVSLVGVDDAGNRSTPVKLQKAEWVATPSQSSAQAGPLAVRTIPVARDPRDLGGPKVATSAPVSSADGASLAQTTSATWTNRTAGGSPPVRYLTNMAFDSARGRVVLFGGVESGGGYLADTWEHDGSKWRQVAQTGDHPSARDAHGMVFDSARNRIVLFGGGGGFGCLQDTWEWDGTTWTNVTPNSLGPSARSLAGMAYDPIRERVVLFGGETGWPGPEVTVQDTWEWDGRDWHPMAPSGNVPSRRQRHAMAFDPVRGKVVLHGGVSGATYFSDMWEWDGVSWTQIAPSGPTPGARRGAGFAADPVRRRLVLFGGMNAAGELGDTWEWDGGGWTNPSSSPAPANRASSSMVWNGASGRVLLFGGGNATQDFQDVWEWDGVRWLGGAPSALEPPARFGHTAVYDASRGVTVVFGGASSTGFPPTSFHRDTWEFDGVAWRNVTPSGQSPLGRYRHTMAYDPVRQRVVLFGGGSTPLNFFGDTWLWNGATWTDTGAPSPSARYGAAMAFDPTKDGIFLFGGFSDAASYMRDAYLWNGSAWFVVSDDTHLPARYCHTLTYDAAFNRLVLFGGYGEQWYGSLNRTYLDDTHSLNGWVWQSHSWTPTPRRRMSHAAVFDPDRQRLIITEGSSDSPTWIDDTWEWEAASSTWTDVTPQGTRPSARWHHAAVYDERRKRMLLLGGYDDQRVPLQETWEWDASATHQPATQVDVSLLDSSVPLQGIAGIRVRAFAGGAGWNQGQPVPGSTLLGWSRRGGNGEPGAWIALASNATLAAREAPHLPSPTESSLNWSTSSPETAQRLVTDRDKRLSLQVRPNGSSGVAVDGALLALDYIEVRIRYTTEERSNWYGFAASAPTVAFGGAPYCSYTMATRDLRMSLDVNEDTGQLVEGEFQGTLEEAADPGCPFPPSPMTTCSCSGIPSTFSQDGGLTSLTFACGYPCPGSNVVYEGTLGGNGAFAWTRTDQGPPLNWVITGNLQSVSR